MKSDICEIIESSKIIAIIRRLDNQHLLKTAQALYDGGIRLIEVPFLPERYPNTYEANQIKLFFRLSRIVTRTVWDLQQ